MSDSSSRGTGNRAWRLWQLLVLPICYPIFLLGSLIMLSMIPVAVLRYRTHEARRTWLRLTLHRGAKAWVALHDWLGVLEVSQSHHSAGNTASNSARTSDTRRSHAPVEPEYSGSTLVIANHPSLIDVLLITAAHPNLCCVLKGALHYNPLFTLLIRYLDYLPNSDPERMLQEAKARLGSGEQLLIFPEGTRTQPGQPLNFRFGAAEIALMSGAAVLPITIHTNSPYLSKGHPWYRLPDQKLHYHLEFGPPFDCANGDPETMDRTARRLARRALNARWQTHFAQRLDARGVGN